MPNHVHVIIVPSDEDGLRRTFADTHRRYTGFINAAPLDRASVAGAVWRGGDGRGASCRRSPVCCAQSGAGEAGQAGAGLAWSCVRAQLGHCEDPLLSAGPAAERYGDFAAFLGDPVADETAWKALRMSETSGRPLGTAQWIEALEAQTGRTLKPQKRGPKPRQAAGLNV